MTTQPPGPEQVEEALTAYDVALAALVAASVAETGALYDRLVPGLVEEVPPRVRSLLVTLLAKSWAAQIIRARSLAALTSYAVTGRIPPALTDPDVPRLIRAAETTLDRAATMAVGADDADARPAYDGRDLLDDLRDVGGQRIREALDRQAAEEAERRESLAAAEEERADAEALARMEAEWAAEDAAQERRDRIDAARDEIRADREDAAEDRAASREVEMEYAQRRRRDAEARAAARRDARAERRRAQRARAVNLARSEAAAAAADTLPTALAADPRYVGWVRKVNDGACERCLGWWLSGGVPRGASPVRPWSVRMKRHNGCTCTQRPATQEETDVRGYTTEPEPSLTNRPTRTDTDGAPDPADA